MEMVAEIEEARDGGEKKDGDKEKLLSAINDSAQHIGAVTLTFLAVCVYIGIAVASTTDEVLLLGKNIALPLFDVQIPLDQFYVLAPALLTFLHLHLLLLEYLLVYKVAKFCEGKNPPREETDLFFPSLPISILLGRKQSPGHPGMVRFLLWLLLVAITTVLPLGLLIATQVKFLPHHSAPVTAWHKFLVLLDLAFIWYFYLRTPKVPGSDDKDSVEAVEKPLEREILRGMGRVGGVLLTLVTIYLSTFVAGRPLLHQGSRFEKFTLLTQLFRENLSVTEYGLDHGGNSDQQEHPAGQSRGAQLLRRDLQDGNFTKSVFTYADFRGADLSRAVFEGADLRNARFSPAKGINGLLDLLAKGASPESLERKRATILDHITSLRNANLRGVDLQNADLVMADLREADLESAKLDGADLRLADLRGAKLRGASLRGANLERSTLNRADVREAEMAGADFSGAYLLGTDFWRSKMHGVDFSRTDLRGAKLVDVEALAADFSGANALGADFQNAWLNAAAGLRLRGVDLRGSHLSSVDLCSKENLTEETPHPQASDLRFVEFQNGPPKGWDLVREDLQNVQKSMGERTTGALVRFKKLADEGKLTAQPCLVPLDIKPEEFSRALLYYGSPSQSPMEKWPPTGIGEKEYQSELASVLVDEACHDYELAMVLRRELLGESVPRRRLLAVAMAHRLMDRRPVLEKCPGLHRLFSKDVDMIEKISREDPLLTDR
jgi:uncharacterized protein YjbI with pentapeptide repeats